MLESSTKYVLYHALAGTRGKDATSQEEDWVGIIGSDWIGLIFDIDNYHYFVQRGKGERGAVRRPTMTEGYVSSAVCGNPGALFASETWTRGLNIEYFRRTYYSVLYVGLRGEETPHALVVGVGGDV